MSNVIWITGLSASGKTTLASSLTNSLKDQAIPTVMLDGDVLRECLDVKQLNSREDRRKLAYTYSRLARMLSEQGITVVVATIALFKEIHTWNRENIDGYFEVFLDVPIEELKRRDPKGLYKRYFDGQIKDVAGLDIQVDFPSHPNVLISFTSEQTPEMVLKKVLDEFIKTNKK